MSIRYDSHEIKARYDNAGYLHDEPVVARTGVLIYKLAGGKQRVELRLDEDVFAPESLNSFVGQPITIGHGAMVNAKNFKKHGVGTVIGAGRQDGDGVRAPIVVQDERGIEAARDKGFNQLSVGYKISYIPRSGMYNEITKEVAYDDERSDEKGDQEFIGKEWVRFDGVQKDIRVNHVALVRNARAGSIARLNLDGDEECAYNDDDPNNPKGKKTMLIRLDSGDNVEVEDTVGNAFVALQNKAQTEQARADSASAQVSTLQAQVDAFPAKLEEARNDALEQIKSRNALEVVANKFGVKVEASQTDIDIKKAVIGATTKINLDGKDDVYIGAAFDIAAQSTPLKQSMPGKFNKDETRSDSNGDADAPAAMSARQAMIARSMKGAK